jgi:L-lysine exporter family protein LysE/ArgO
MHYYLQGLLLGLAYVAPIGIQNLYMINTALKSNLGNSLKVALITVFFDISLALACFFGIGFAIDHFIVFKKAMLLFGCIAVTYIGYKLITSKPTITKTNLNRLSFTAIVSACFMVTWLNPQAIIDGSLLLGGYRASLQNNDASLFILGVTSASFIWFMGLATIVSLLKRFVNEKILKIINIACGIIVIYFGIKMGLTFITLMN